jgi:hypothetical protein
MSEVPHVGQIGAWLGASRTRSPHSGQVKTAFFVRGGAAVIAVDATEEDSTLGAAMVGADACRAPAGTSHITPHAAHRIFGRESPSGTDTR